MRVLDGFKYIFDENYNPELNRLLQSDGEISESIIYRCSVSSTDSRLVLSDYNPAKIPIFSEQAYKTLLPYIKDDIYRPIKCTYDVEDSYIGEAYGIRPKQVDCLDYEKSRYKCIGDNLIIVSRYVFNDSKIGNRKLFKIPKCPFVFVTEVFVKVVKSSSLKGFDFSLKYDGERVSVSKITNPQEYINKYWEYDKSPDADTIKELNSNIRIGREMLGINEQSSIDVIKEIDRYVDSLDNKEIEFSIQLGCVLGDVICREHHWKWAVLGHDASNTVTVVKSPQDYYFIDPINIISRIITRKRDNNLVLLFNMLYSIEKK